MDTISRWVSSQVCFSRCVLQARRLSRLQCKLCVTCKAVRSQPDRQCAAAGSIVDMQELGVWEPYAVKVQTIQTAIESATLLLRIDDIVSGLSRKGKAAPGQQRAPQQEGDPDQVGSCPTSDRFPAWLSLRSASRS